MNKYEDIFIKNLPTLDLHGYDRDSARVATNDFVNDAVFMGFTEIVIIHGIGSGVVKNVVHDTLSRHKQVLFYQLNGMNIGCTIVKLRRRDD